MKPLRFVTTAALVGLVTGSACLGGCEKGKPWDQREVDPGLVRLDAERMHLRHDTVGHDQWESRATFALIDAHNSHGEDLLVTVGGELVAEDGAVVALLRAESLRVPAGGMRTFALVDDQNALRPRATSARVRVLGAYVPTYVPPVQITDGKAYMDGDRAVVNAMVRNAVDRPGTALIFAGFHDREGKPLTRPFTRMYLLGDSAHPALFVGPPGSVGGYIFVGDTVY
jgi:hypothetical protein